MQGEGRYSAEGVEYPLRDNTAILLHPYAYHFVRPNANKPYERYVISFSSEFLDPALLRLPILSSGAESRGIYFPSEVIGNGFSELFRSLDCYERAERFAPNGGIGEILIKAVLSEALIRLCIAYPNAPEPNTDTRVAQMVDWINRHLTEKLTLDDMAKSFYLNKFYLCRTFREETGMTVFAYLQTKRIAMAEQLLQAGVPAAEVAERVGYSDYSTFWRAYRKQTGHPPVHGSEK